MPKKYGIVLEILGHLPYMYVHSKVLDLTNNLGRLITYLQIVRHLLELSLNIAILMYQYFLPVDTVLMTI